MFVFICYTVRPFVSQCHKAILPPYLETILLYYGGPQESRPKKIASTLSLGYVIVDVITEKCRIPIKINFNFKKN